jgi:hypothetical protein
MAYEDMTGRPWGGEKEAVLLELVTRQAARRLAPGCQPGDELKLIRRRHSMSDEELAKTINDWPALQPLNDTQR